MKEMYFSSSSCPFVLFHSFLVSIFSSCGFLFLFSPHFFVFCLLTPLFPPQLPPPHHRPVPNDKTISKCVVFKSDVPISE